MGGEAALVERESGSGGRILSGARTVARGHAIAAEPGDDVSAGRFDEHLQKLADAGRRIPAVLQLWLGRGANAESNHASAVLAYREVCSAGAEVMNAF